MSQGIAEEHVSVSRISDLLNTTFMDHTVDGDGDIHVTDGVEFPCWIAIAQRAKLIELFSYFPPEQPTPSHWLTRVNEFNRTIMVPQFSFQQDAVWGRYWMTFDGGLDMRQFIKMLRRFSGAVSIAAGGGLPEATHDANAP